MIKQFYKIFQKWSETGTVWIYSDTHFEDADCAAAVPSRPSSAEQVRMINSKVGKKDTLILLGDVGDIEYAKQLKGYKVLIMGNHDSGASNYEGVFDEVYTGPLFVGEKILLSHEPLDFPNVLNIHGHQHNKHKSAGKNHINVCSDVIDYTPVNMNQLMKSGVLGKVTTTHRATIDTATKRARKRGK